MADDIRRWSDELARDPSSLVFLQLSEALRRQGQLDVALKIALRGLERHPRNADAHDLVARIAVDRRDFARAFEALEAWRAEGRTAILCAEALWWRCHRRLLADLLVTRGVETVHILPDGRGSIHELWDLARTGPEGLTYPPIQTGLGF